MNLSELTKEIIESMLPQIYKEAKERTKKGDNDVR